jgi:sugar lactone lactonase YvrE
VAQRGQKVRLTGLARLIAHPEAPLLGDMGGSLLSNNGGTLISDNGGGLISNNGGTVLGKVRLRRLLQAGLGVYGLTDAEVRLYDAAGRLLVDEAGKPLAATTGPDATYAMEAVLPPGNLVARIQLWNGGELTAIVVHEGARQGTWNLTTTSSLAAGYVLGLAQGRQEVLDKLPAAENERLVRELDAVRRFAAGAFRHDATTLDAVTAGLRARVPAVEQVAADIRALLLGQARLGAGRRATEVPLNGPTALVVGREGLLFAERRVGRIRRLGADGTLQALLDRTFGAIKANHLGILDLVEAPDGTLYFTQDNTFRVFRVTPGELPTPFLGSGRAEQGPVAPPLAMDAVPRALALGPDGTLWVGEGHGGGRAPTVRKPPRVLAVRPDGVIEAYENPAWAGSDEKRQVTSLLAAPDGTLWVLEVRAPDSASGVRLAQVSRLRQGVFETIGEELPAGTFPDMALAPDGQVIVSRDDETGVGTLTPSGQWRPLPALPALRELGLVRAASLASAPDGTLYIGDMAAGLVAALPPDGAPRLVAGTRAVFQTAEGQGFAVNGPGGLATDDAGRLFISELGSHTVRVFDGAKLQTYAGSVGGYAGDGGPATAARLNGPKGIAWQAGRLWVVDDQNGVLRRVESDGSVHTAALKADSAAIRTLRPGEAVERLSLEGSIGLTVGPKGDPVWTDTVAKQVLRLATDGPTPTFRHVAGAFGANATDWASALFLPPVLDAATIRFIFPFGLATGPDGSLYVSDFAAMQVYRVRGHDTAQPTLELVAGRHFSEVVARHAEDPTQRPEEGIDARTATLGFPTGLACDAAGNLYVCEAGTRNLESLLTIVDSSVPLDASLLPELPARVRRIAPDGTITAVVGPGGRHLTDPDGELALNAPTGIVRLRDGRLAIADSGSNLVHVLPAGTD